MASNVKNNCNDFVLCATVGVPTVSCSFATVHHGVIFIMPCKIIFLVEIFLLVSSKLRFSWHFHHHICQPLRYFALTFLTLRVGAYFAGTSQTRGRSSSCSPTHKPNILLKTSTIPTYHSISIAVPRYIDMQLSSYIT